MTGHALPAPALVVVPTYDERESLPAIVARLFAANPGLHLLVVDDASPDGTGELADHLAADDPRVHVLHRTAKDGLGRAYLAGFAWALERGYDRVVQMDADGSHPPETLRAMLERSALGADLVIGSRWVPGGSIVDWPWHREALSRTANAYTGWILRVPIRDATAGFRVYTAECLRAIGLDEVAAHGYWFQVEMTVRVVDAGLTAAEVPIEFREREAAASKMSAAIVLEAMRRVTVLGVQRRLRPRSSRPAATG